MSKLDGVHPGLVRVTELALSRADGCFRVTCGIRNDAHQAALVASGASRTMNSKHLIQPDGYGHAVDLVALVGGGVSWDWNHYYRIADLMGCAARDLGVTITWGGVWDMPMSQYTDTKKECAAYVERKLAQYKREGKKKQPFIDGPHFQL